MPGIRRIPPGRIERAETLFLSATGDREIIRALRAEFAVGKCQARRYLALARARCAKACAGLSADELRAKIEALLLNAYRVAETGTPTGGPQVSSMVQAAAKLGEVYGCFAPKRLEHSGKVEGGVRIFLPPEDDDEGAAPIE